MKHITYQFVSRDRLQLRPTTIIYALCRQRLVTSIIYCARPTASRKVAQVYPVLLHTCLQSVHVSLPVDIGFKSMFTFASNRRSSCLVAGSMPALMLLHLTHAQKVAKCVLYGGGRHVYLADKLAYSNKLQMGI